MTPTAKTVLKRLTLVTLAVVALVILIFALGTSAYFAKHYALITDENGNTTVARLGMKLDLLFDRLLTYDAEEAPQGIAADTPIGIIDPVTGESVLYDPDAPWGSAQNPYIISKARHMHNLSVLQNIGYFYNRYISDNFDGEGVYDGGTKMPYFLICDIDGTPVTIDGTSTYFSPIGSDEYPFVGYIGGAFAEGDATVLEKSSDVSVLYGFHVETTKDTPDVGLFGHIGYLGNEEETTEDEGDTVFVGYASTIENFLLCDVTIRVVDHAWAVAADHLFSFAEKVLESQGENSSAASIEAMPHEDHHVGILAGHAEYTIIRDISIYYSTDDIVAIDVCHTTQAGDKDPTYMSATGIIGFVYNLNPEVRETAEGATVVSVGTGETVAGTRILDTGDQWGGSIDMKDLHTRLNNIFDLVYQNTSTYNTSEAVIRLLDAKEDPGDPDSVKEGVIVSLGTANMPTYSTRVSYHTYYSDAAGSFNFSYDTSDSDRHQYMCLYGPTTKINNTNTQKTVYTYTYDGTSVDAWLFSDGAGHYLAVGNSGAVASMTEAEAQASGGLVYTTTDGVTTLTNANYATAAKWTFDGNNKLYTYREGANVYLAVSDGELTAAASAGSAPAWTYDAVNQRLYMTDASSYRWDLYYDGGWKVSPFVGMTTFTLADGSGHYLNADATATVSVGNAAGTATRYTWIDGQLAYTSGGAVRYLTTANGISATGTKPSVTWTTTDNVLSYTTGDTFYVCYVPSLEKWDVVTDSDTVTIHDGNNHYLRVAADRTVTSSAQASATRFTFAGGYLSAVVNGTRWYLRSNNGALTTDTQGNATVWAYDGTNNRFTCDNGESCLAYDSAWKTVLVLDLTSYTIASGTNNYMVLNNSNNATTNQTSANNATKWSFDRTNGSTLSTVKNGTRYYIKAGAAVDGVCPLSVVTDAAQATIFEWYNNRIYFDNRGYYIDYMGLNATAADGWRGIAATASVVFLRNSGSSRFLRYNGSWNSVTTSNTNTGQMSRWLIDNPDGSTTTVSTIYNGTRYYMNHNNTNSAVAASTTAFTWNYANNRYYYQYGNNNRYAGYGYNSNTITWRYNRTTNDIYQMYRTAAPNLTLTETAVTAVSRQATAVLSHTMTQGNTAASAATVVRDGEDVLRAVYTKATATGVASGSASYFPLAAPSSSPYGVKQDNTGYIVSGSYATYQGQYGDIRVSYFDMSRIGTAVTDTSTINATYLGVNNQGTVQTSTTAAAAIRWTYDGTTGTLSARINNNTRYLRGTNGTLSTTTTAGDATSWTYNRDRRTLSYTYNATEYFLRYNNSAWGVATADGAGNYSIAFDLMSDDTYLISLTSDFSTVEVLTRTYKTETLNAGVNASYRSLNRISDSYNGSNNSVSNDISNYNKQTVETLGLQKYDNARYQLGEVLKQDSAHIYGMHFMDAVISIDHLITAKQVTINGDTFYNYQMPEDSIDFILKDRGFINFFAGTYYTNTGYENNCFFSLSKIERDTNNNITAINTIDKIYGVPGNDTKPYIYKYKNAAAPELPSGYVLMFDLDWIENPTMIYNALYYYEIPVNRGEYALGSVAQSGKYGAYLIYLDIGASATELSWRDGAAGNTLGSIDFVYDYTDPETGDTRIVTVKDTPPSAGGIEDYRYYYATLSLLYTRNYGVTGTAPFPLLNDFAVSVRRVNGTDPNAVDGRSTLFYAVVGEDAADILIRRCLALADETVRAEDGARPDEEE